MSQRTAALPAVTGATGATTTAAAVPADAAIESLRILLREIVALGHSADPAGAALHAEAAALLSEPAASDACLRDLLPRIHQFAAARRQTAPLAAPAEALFARLDRALFPDAAPEPDRRPRRRRTAGAPVAPAAPAAPAAAAH